VTPLSTPTLQPKPSRLGRARGPAGVRSPAATPGIPNGIADLLSVLDEGRAISAQAFEAQCAFRLASLRGGVIAGQVSIEENIGIAHASPSVELPDMVVAGVDDGDS
jgi:hypothetical protein